MLTRDYTIEVTNLDFNEGRNDGVAVTSAGSFAPESRQITTSAHHHSIWYRPDALPDAQRTMSKH